MCAAVAYAGAMGFSNGGAAAFEARQEAARKKAADTAAAQLTPRIPPRPLEPPRMAAFEQQLEQARREAQEAEENQDQHAAWVAQQNDAAGVRMAALSQEFSHRADALGQPATLTFVAAQQERYGSDCAYTFIEVVGEGCRVSDHYGHEHDYDRRATAFYVTRGGPWIVLDWGTPTIFGKGRGLPPELNGKDLVVFNAPRDGIQYVGYKELWGKDIEGLIAGELVRLERLQSAPPQ